MIVVQNSDLSYLIPRLRLLVGDLDGKRYLDAQLDLALIAAFNGLQAWWDYKYTSELLFSGNNYYTITGFIINRNSFKSFETDSGIDPKDEHAVVLYAAIILLSGYLENNAWNLGSWRDHEIAVSNVEGGRALREKLNKLYEELYALYKPPSKQLGRSKAQGMGGYIYNTYEYGDPSDWVDSN